MTFLTELMEEKRDLIEKKTIIEKRLSNAPLGTLHIVKAKGKYSQFYYHNSKENEQKIYLGKDQYDLAAQLAQKDYDLKALKEINKQIDAITKFENNYQMNSVLQVYDSLSQERKNLVIPIVQMNEKFVETWKNSKILQHNTYPIENANITDNDEIVRSKAEMAIANKLAQMGIPYVYEPMVKIGGTVFFPDFVLLNVRTRKEFYYEYFGMMDCSDYSVKTVNKLKLYKKNGFVYGQNLLYSFEVNSGVVDIKEIESLMKEYLL